MIELQFSTTSGVSSALIRVFEHGWCSHVDVVLPDGRLLGARSDSIGGAPAGVQIRSAGYEDWSRIERVRLQTSPDMEKRFYDFLHAQIGKPYDRLAIVAFAVNRDWRERDQWFCSELVAAALEVCGWFPLPLSNVANKITPSDGLLVVSPWRTA